MYISNRAEMNAVAILDRRLGRDVCGIVKDYLMIDTDEVKKNKTQMTGQINKIYNCIMCAMQGSSWKYHSENDTWNTDCVDTFIRKTNVLGLLLDLDVNLHMKSDVWRECGVKIPLCTDRRFTPLRKKLANSLPKMAVHPTRGYIMAICNLYADRYEKKDADLQYDEYRSYRKERAKKHHKPRNNMSRCA